MPIIALTANAMEGTKEMFCREGMNDFVAKPVELRLLAAKVKKWLPIEKVQKVYITKKCRQRREKAGSYCSGRFGYKICYGIFNQ